MEGETFEYDGKKHVSLRDGGVYVGVENWVVHAIAEALWEDHLKNLRWREYGSGEFYAFVKENDDYITGNLDDYETVFVNILSVERLSSLPKVPFWRNKKIARMAADRLAIGSTRIQDFIHIF
ncbi:hypothetical protein A9K97_gp336 [Tokyovirus A1]|uniref:hypothetical protein n=1 Tax=Tokyovirus A1 TaxID=1826170 RepID=UPI0007A96229|nr:hypothetical protein A9K97_gp336 [Tokyovirus A1]BAU80015.1 hypothetical protein [Tokyovirus A1]